jgi:hypothetical protein
VTIFLTHDGAVNTVQIDQEIAEFFWFMGLDHKHVSVLESAPGL